jgi:hypothetical protein
MIASILEKLIFNTLFEDYSLEIEFDKGIFEKEFPELNIIPQEVKEKVSYLSFSLKNNNYSVYFSYNFIEDKAKVAHLAKIPFAYFYFQLHLTFGNENRKIIFQGESQNKEIIKTFKVTPMFKVL